MECTVAHSWRGRGPKRPFWFPVPGFSTNSSCFYSPDMPGQRKAVFPCVPSCHRPSSCYDMNYPVFPYVPYMWGQGPSFTQVWNLRTRTPVEALSFPCSAFSEELCAFLLFLKALFAFYTFVKAQWIQNTVCPLCETGGTTVPVKGPYKEQHWQKSEDHSKPYPEHTHLGWGGGQGLEQVDFMPQCSSSNCTQAGFYCKLILRKDEWRNTL